MGQIVVKLAVNMYKPVKSLGCLPETNVPLSVSYTQLKKKKIGINI